MPRLSVKATARAFGVSPQAIRYAIRKSVGKTKRMEEERKFLRAAAEGTQAYFDNDRDAEPFAMLHRGC